MEKIYRKTKKLIRNPKAFFNDSKLFGNSIKTSNEDKSLSTKAYKIASKKQEKESKKFFSAYVNFDFANNLTSRTHLLNILNTETELTVGDFRISNDQIVFKHEYDVFVSDVHLPIEGDQILKGNLPFKIDINTDHTQHSFNKYLNVIHTLNVKHMKSIDDSKMLYEYYKDRPEANELSQIKFALNAGIYNEDIIRRSLIIINEKYLSLPQQDITLIFRKLYRVLGTDGRLESIANKLASSIRKQIYSVPFTMLLAAFFTESGDYEKAIEMALKSKMKEDNAWSRHRYLALTFLLHKNGLLNDEWAVEDSILYLKLNKNEWDFEKYALENHSQINIIGNAPNEIGNKKGSLIDSSLKVARFNGAITDYPHHLDYGRKTDILIINPRYYETQRNNKFGLDFIIISDGNLYSSKNLSYKLHDLDQYCEKIVLIPRKIDISLTQKISASPSSGLKFMEWLYVINGKIPKKNIFGFSLIDQDHGVATSYFKGRRAGLKTIHNWSNEQKHMDNLLKNKELIND